MLKIYWKYDKKFYFLSATQDCWRNIVVKNSLKNAAEQKSILTSTDCFTDIIACKSYAILINMSAVSDDDLDMLWDYYLEVGLTSESVVLGGNINVPKQLKNKMQIYQNFEELQDNLKYVILSAYRNNKKSESFSSTLANAIMILSQIRLYPGITTAQLAKKLEISQRSVQRYIETLRVVGEWIEYDRNLKGWKLTDGKSILWGDW